MNRVPGRNRACKFAPEALKDLTKATLADLLWLFVIEGPPVRGDHDQELVGLRHLRAEFCQHLANCPPDARRLLEMIQVRARASA